jgi:xanthine dehydrogenase small subunit
VRDAITFLLNDQPHTVSGVPSNTTVLEYLRTTLRLTGTKEGCAEGDCGACTVLIGEPSGAGWHHTPVNACILFLPALDGKRLLTVEHLRQPQGPLHPVQQAMVDHHASQCGFCTPGIVMSLAALHETATNPTRSEIDEALAGNLCRCTGYRPIADAAQAACAAEPALPHAPPFETSGSLAYGSPTATYLAPRSLAELADAVRDNPGATLIAGGTDLALVVTKQHKPLPCLIALGQVPDMAQIRETADTIEIGAAATYTAVLPILERHYPTLGALIRRIGSWQIRNRGTIGGNIANASPIGDMPPALLALDATLLLRLADRTRQVPLADFFTGYRETILDPGEFIERIDIPLNPQDQFHCYKIAKRFDQDISAVCGAFRLERADGLIRTARIAFGGMAATPSRAAGAEAALVGQPWTRATIQAAMQALDADFSPLTDMRASAVYRRTVARNLLLKWFLEVPA